MTDLLVQTISEETVGLIVYMQSTDELQSTQKALLDFQEKINKPVLICFNGKIQMLSNEDLQRFGLQRIEVEEVK